MDLNDPQNVSIRTEPSTPLRSASEIAISGNYSVPIPARLPKTDLTHVFNRFNNRNILGSESPKIPGPGPHRGSATPRTMHARTALEMSPYVSPRRRLDSTRKSLTPVRFDLRRKRRRSSLVHGEKAAYDANYIGPITIDYLRFFCQKSIEEKEKGDNVETNDDQTKFTGSTAKKSKSASPSNISVLKGGSKSPSEFDYSLPLPKSDLASPPQHPFLEVKDDELNPFLHDNEEVQGEVLSPFPLEYVNDIARGEKVTGGATSSAPPVKRPVSYLERILQAHANISRKESRVEDDEDDEDEIYELSREIIPNKFLSANSQDANKQGSASPKTPANNHSISDLVIEDMTLRTSRLGEAGYILSEEETSERRPTDDHDSEIVNDFNEEDLDILPMHDEETQNVTLDMEIEDEEDVIDSISHSSDSHLGESEAEDQIIQDQYVLENTVPGVLETEIREGQDQPEVAPQTRIASTHQRRSKSSSSSLPINIIKGLMKNINNTCAEQSRVPIKPLSSETYNFIQDVSDSFIDTILSDLEAYSSHRSHGKSRQINVQDVLLFMKRTNFISRRNTQTKQEEINTISRLAHDFLPLELLVGLEKSLTASLKSRPTKASVSYEQSNDGEDEDDFNHVPKLSDSE